MDTLEATFDGEIPEETVEELKRRKGLAIASGDPNKLMLGGQVYYMNPKGGGGWPYSIRNDYMIIRLGTSKHLPKMYVHLLAQGLAELGVATLWSQVLAVADDLELTFRNCTRLDIALHYQGDFFTFEDSLNVTCPSSFRPIYPNTSNPETYQFGKGDMVVRVYRKSVEIAAKDNEWWVFVWRICPGYREGEPVHRVEVQMRGKVLRELGFFTIERILEDLPELFAYGLEWCSMRVPTADSNRSRWPEDPRWSALRTASSPARELRRIRSAAAIISYDKAVRRLVSVFTYAGAAVGSTDYWHLAQMLTTDAEQLIEREMDTSLEALVAKRLKRRYL